MRAESAILLAAGMTFMAGCNASFAPPIRSGQDGAPGRLHEGDLEVAGSWNLANSGGPDVGYALTDVVSIEGGAEIQGSGSDMGWALGYLGPRFTLNRRTKDKDGELGQGPAADAGIGFGMGAGGSKSPWWEHRAEGGYADFGGAYYFPFIAIYGRARVEQAFATGLPPTLWWSTTAGLQFWYGPLAIYAATGAVGYDNDTVKAASNTHFETWLPVEAGLSLHFDLTSHAKPAAATQTASLKSGVGAPHGTNK
jgi:hypothetical protein